MATESKNQELEDKLRLTELRCRDLAMKLLPQTEGFKCVFCSKILFTNSGYTRHVRSKHGGI